MFEVQLLELETQESLSDMSTLYVGRDAFSFRT